jgi:ferric-dicitrate binding protein FerR (iron transport regulator)
MSNAGKHIDPNQEFEKQTDNFFSKVQVPFKASKEDIWDELEAKLDFTKTVLPARKINYRWTFAIAATVLLLVAVFSLFRFYTTTIECPAGQHLTANLPDGSTVQLNASSTLSYKPLWWQFSRTLSFEGEGFFDVQKGEKFTVKSSIASTTVLGTSFNIYARDDRYEVSCHSGKVKVRSKNNEEGILSPGYEAKLSLDGKVVIYKSQENKSSISWIDNKFIFTAIPLRRVFEEIERQYDVQITIPEGITHSYTGYFTKDKSPEAVLGLVCKPFGLTFVANSGNSFTVIRNE